MLFGCASNKPEVKTGFPLPQGLTVDGAERMMITNEYQTNSGVCKGCHECEVRSYSPQVHTNTI